MGFGFQNAEEIKALTQDTACSKDSEMLGVAVITVVVCVSLLLLNSRMYLLCHSKLLNLLKTILFFLPSYLKEFQALSTSTQLMFTIMTRLIIIIC